MKFNQSTIAVFILIVATTLEVCGDAIVRKSIYEYTGAYRIFFMIAGAILLFGYGYVLNLSPIEFSKVVGLYIAILFIMWQVINYAVFRTVPSLSLIVGGGMIVLGGLIVTFGKF
jgi:small multidrug resistance family-3 protein